MKTYYSNLDAIHQQTLQLQLEQCKHCQQTQQLVSHGFIRKKRNGGDPQAIGKRVFCSNRYHHTGCGRTMQLYLDSTLRYLHHAGSAVVAFVLLLLAGMSIGLAYMQATGKDTPRHAYRWLNRLHAQISTYRSLFHQPLLEQQQQTTVSTHGQSPNPNPLALRRNLLVSTFDALLMRFKQPLCQAYQSQLQHPFF
jgi:transposase-like protein